MLVKRTLTSMQIMQFLVGASYAMAHSFVSYVIPVAVQTAKTSLAAVDPAAARETSTTASSAATAQDGVTYAHKVVPCITSSGETFAIWLNVLYLAPLTYLFAKFFVASYLRRSSAESARAKKDVDGTRVRRLSNVTLAEKAGWDAAKNLQKEVYGNDSPVSPVSPSVAVEDGETDGLLHPSAAGGRARRTDGKAGGQKW